MGEYQALQAALRNAKTPEERAAASEAMRQYIQSKGKSSKPTMVTLSRGGGKDNAIPLDELADAMVRSPQVYERIKRIVTKEK